MSFDKSASFAHWKSQASVSSHSHRRPTSTSESEPTTNPRNRSPLDTTAVDSTSNNRNIAGRSQERVASRTALVSSANKNIISSRSRGSPNPFTAPLVTSPSGISASGGAHPRADTSSPTSSSQGLASPTASSFEKISVAQLAILLDTNSDKDVPKRWDNTKSERAQKLLDSGGHEVFAVFVRKSILLSFSTIFTDEQRQPHGTYRLLQERVEDVRRDPLRAFQFVDAIDAAKEDQFRSLDVAAFVSHFLHDVPSQIILTYAFCASSKASARAKAEQFYSTLLASFRDQVEDQLPALERFSSASLAFFITCLAYQPILTPEDRTSIAKSIQEVSIRKNAASTLDVAMASQSWKLPDRDRHIIDAFKKAGPRSAANKSSIEEIVSALPASAISPQEIANALLFMLFAQPSQHYNINEFVTAIRTSTKARQLDWNAVVKAFDVPDLRIYAEPFAKLFKALQQIAADDQSFDIQNLWRGQWNYPDTQVSFLRSFFEMPDVPPAQIPGFQAAFQASDFDQAPSEVRQRVEAELETHHANFFAMKAVFEVVLASDTLPDQESGSAILHAVVRRHLVAFMLSLSHIAAMNNPTPTQEKFLDSCFHVYLDDPQGEGDIVLQALFHQDRQLVECLCRIAFHADPRQTFVIAQKAQQLGWTDFLLQSFFTPLALDIACLLQKESNFDLDQWITQVTQPLTPSERMQVGTTLWKFLRIKADDEYRHQKDGTEYQSISLSLPAVFVLLWKIRDLVGDREQIKNAQCTCLTTYPRLMNFGTDFDAILERMSQEHGHKLAPETDQRMSELFGQMYRAELSIRDVINEMRRYKTSQNPQLQDLFCCIVHGLFDEYGCYGEYPEEALEKTALLFGSIVKFRLLPVIPQEYGLTLIVDAVRDQSPDNPMHRFGIEALLQVGDQLIEWPRICEMLLQIPTLQHPEIIQRARDGLKNAQLRAGAAQRESEDDHLLQNGSGDDGNDAAVPGFRSLHADPAPADGNFHEPDQKSQEKILFVINNLSKENMESKLSDMREVLRPAHYQWFAAYLVEQRARLELNNQGLYNMFLSELNSPALSREVLRETYVSIVKMMSAQTTMESSVEKGHLKSLGAWLGSLTLAKDKPIKHQNIYFMDLLLEAFETQRLAIVIPFTCKVLVQGKDSVVFKPPNPWLLEIVGVLIELYNHADLKLNLKFEIEVLCQDLALDHKKVEEADFIRAYQRQQQSIEELTNASALDNIDEYDLTLRGSRLRETFSVEQIMQSLPDLDTVLRWPPPSGSQQDQSHVRTVIKNAVRRAIEEIIAPVVERSITIASLSSNQLVSKDYAAEPDADRFRNAAQEMVKSLAGSLALVTCKEPLRMSIQNFIRQFLEESGGAYMAEGTILMTVNDNLDIAAHLIKEAAEQRAVPEMDQIIEAELAERRRFVAEHPGSDAYHQNLNRWSTWIPDPYKMVSGSLNEAQRAVYEDFARRVNGMNAGHVQNASTDSTGRQLPDVLNESLAMPNLSTPAAQPALPHQSPMTQHESRANSTMPQQRVNGIPDSVPPAERLSLLLDEVSKAARSSSVSLRLPDLPRDSPMSQHMQQILRTVAQMAPPSMEGLARHSAEKITTMLLRQPPTHMLEAQALTVLLHKLSTVSETIIREVIRWITANEETLLGNSYIVAAFIANGLMEFSRVDSVIAGALKDRSEVGLRLLHDLMDETMFNNEPIALRADLANSIIALFDWLREEPEHPLASDISNKLKSHGVPEFVTVALSDKERAKEDQMRYVFQEWVALYENSPYNETTSLRLLRDLHSDQLINSAEDLVTFLRLTIAMSTDGFELEMQNFRGTFTAAFGRIDALAQLLILLVKFQGGDNGAVKLSKASYLDTILSLIVLVENHHAQLRGIEFNCRVFTRLFASMLYYYAEHGLNDSPEHTQFMLAFAKLLQSTQPSIMPNFVFGWTSLICHRVFVEGMLGTGTPECTMQYRELIGRSVEYPAYLAEHPRLRQYAEVLMRGVYRNIFVLQNDYPDFMCQNHAYFCARVSLMDPALRNLFLSAPPFGISEPNPLAAGLRVERIEDMKKAPPLSADISQPLEREGLLDQLNQSLRKNSDVDSILKKLTEVVTDESKNQPSEKPARDCEILESLVVCVGRDAVSHSTKFDSNSNHVQLISRLLNSLPPRQQYLLVLSIFDQIRYPNSHTEYFCKVILHLWGGSAYGSGEQAYIREIVIRVLRERIDPLRPNPWGAVVVFKELTENPVYSFWDQQPFVNEPELRQRLVVAARGH